MSELMPFAHAADAGWYVLVMLAFCATAMVWMRRREQR